MSDKMFIKPLDRYFSNEIKRFEKELKGSIHIDNLHRLMYATDASVYRELPKAVAYPADQSDIIKLVQFAKQHHQTLIPRSAGTSLAGQVVGGGIIVDVSKHMCRIIELNTQEKWVRVEPGVILDSLNKYVAPYGLFFGPETSTSNRCMIGGMLGNNACGAHSLVYGSTRDHIIALKAVLSDGSVAEFSGVASEALEEKRKLTNLEGSIYKHILSLLDDAQLRRGIQDVFPHPSIRRRNMGYAVDILASQKPFQPSGEEFNLAKLLTGSEGTLAFATEIKLNLVDMPPQHKGLLCAHFSSLNESLKANLLALKHGPVSIELIDKVIVACTKENIEQRKNRFFIKGEPEAILLIEFAEASLEKVKEKAFLLVEALKGEGMGYHYPLVTGADINRVWALRKAGLGLLSNVKGDAKPVAVIEDTAVRAEDLPDYIEDFQAILQKYKLSCVYYAHAATGELHLRPVLNLKTVEGQELFKKVLYAVAALVKKYRGTLSGEHGDGRLRSELIPEMFGADVYAVFKEIKHVWDREMIFNRHKIVDSLPMNTHLRYQAGRTERHIDTVLDFGKDGGILRAAELCNGAADCRKTIESGGLMCPSYMATLRETDSTRARANIVREFLTNSTQKNPFAHPEIMQVMDLCLSCKACKSECPSNVDIAKIKTECLHHYYTTYRRPWRTYLIAYIATVYKWTARIPFMFNFFAANKITSGIIKKMMGFASQRSIPKLYKFTLNRWARKHLPTLNTSAWQTKRVFIFNDEFTNYNDVPLGIKTIKLLSALGYEVCLLPYANSARTFLSKGFLNEAKKIINDNIIRIFDVLDEDAVLIGVEPSAILGFRDEYLDLAKTENYEKAQKLSSKALMLDEFLDQEYEKGLLNSACFKTEPGKVYLHGHCHQKALASVAPIAKIFRNILNYEVVEIKSSCCGMAGSFGYEKEHYEVSVKVADLVLVPTLKKAEEKALICAPGISCRQQIFDTTGRKAWHPAEILCDALNPNFRK